MIPSMRRLKKIVENADFDVRHKDMSQTNSIGGDKGDFETTNKGRADVKSRYANPRYGDNAMKDLGNDSGMKVVDERLNSVNTGDDEFTNKGQNPVPDPDSSIIDRIHSILQKAGVSDEEIRDGVDLTDLGRQKVAARLGVSADEIPMLLGSLTTRLNDDDKQDDRSFESAYHSFMNEDDNYSYNKDSNGNVVVKNDSSGKTATLQGDQAENFQDYIQQSPDSEQDVMSDMEPIMEDEPEDESDFVKEMKKDEGSFNFSWDADGKHGTGTAKYVFVDQDLKVKVVVIRDSEGKQINPEGNTKKKITKCAFDFIKSSDL